jgi:cytochrome c-type biogenesis protein CcmF
VVVPLGPFLAWKRGNLGQSLRRLWIALAVAAGVALIVLVAEIRGPWLAPVGLALGAWLVAGAAMELASRIGLFKVPLKASLSRLIGLPGASLGMALAHGGLGILVIGIISISLWKVEVVTAMKPGDRVGVGAYTVTFEGETPLTGPNYTGLSGHFLVTRDGKEVARLDSEKRQFRPSGMTTTAVGLHESLAGDIYIVMGDETGTGGRAVRLYFNPLVDFIWLGALAMFVGGIFSLTDRRYRVGAPRIAAQVLAAAE